MKRLLIYSIIFSIIFDPLLVRADILLSQKGPNENAIAYVNIATDENKYPAFSEFIESVASTFEEINIKPIVWGPQIQRALFPNTDPNLVYAKALENLEMARDKYFNMDFDGALTLLKEAEKQLITLMPIKAVQMDLAEAIFYTATIQLTMGEESEAEERLKVMATIAQNPPIDFSKFTPKVVEKFKEIKQKFPGLKYAVLPLPVAEYLASMINMKYTIFGKVYKNDIGYTYYMQVYDLSVHNFVASQSIDISDNFRPTEPDGVWKKAKMLMEVLFPTTIKKKRVQIIRKKNEEELSPPPGDIENKSNLGRLKVIKEEKEGPSKKSGIFKKWWFWTILGGVVAGSTVGAIILTGGSGGNDMGIIIKRHPY